MSDQPDHVDAAIVPIEALIPGGIRETDHAHVVTSDETCNRCRRPLREDEVPLRCWEGDGTVMWIRCSDCSGFGRETLDDTGTPDPE